MIGYAEQQKLIAEAVKQFPPTFSLKAFPNDTFRISLAHSYVNDNRVVMLYPERLMPNGEWAAFSKGTVEELKREVR